MTTTDALQATLAAEHAAVWLYGVLGAQTSASSEAALHNELSQAYTLHRSRRDELSRTLRDLAQEPVSAAAAYETPSPIRSPRQRRSAAIEIEDRCATTYAALVANTVAAQRAWAVAALTDAAVRRVRLGGEPEQLPGD
ncbi:ferritin-like domain-containing protein [Nocardioides pacificus]